MRISVAQTNLASIKTACVMFATGFFEKCKRKKTKACEMEIRKNDIQKEYYSVPTQQQLPRSEVMKGGV